MIQGGGQDLSRQDGQVRKAQEEQQRKSFDLNSAKAALEREEGKRLQALKARIEATIDANPLLKKYKNQLLLDITSEGLRIQIVDEQNRPMLRSPMRICNRTPRKSCTPSAPCSMKCRTASACRAYGFDALRQTCRLQQLGIVGRPRECVAARTGDWRHEGRESIARGGPGFGSPPGQTRPLQSDQPAHQHHRHEQTHGRKCPARRVGDRAAGDRCRIRRCRFRSWRPVRRPRRRPPQSGSGEK